MMKTRMRAMIALMLALMLALGASGQAEMISETFRLSGVTERPTSGEAGSDSATGVTPGAFGAEQASVDLPEPVKYRVNLDPSLTVYVYADMSLSAQAVALLYGEAEVDVTGYEGDWSKVLLPNGATGYIPSMYLTRAESIMDSAPVMGEETAGSEASDNSEVSAGPEAEEKPAVSKFAEPVKYRVNLNAGELANVFVEATTASRLIAQMYGGFEVDVTGYVGAWYQIRLPNGMVGFVESQFLTEAQPEATEEPTPEPTATPEPTPEPTEVPQVQEPEFIEDSEDVQEPEATEEPAPEVTEEPAATEVPEVTEEPAATEEPEATPAATEEPQATEEPAATPEATEQPQGVAYVVFASKVNVRIGPSTDARAIAQATQGYVFNVIGAEGDWSKVLLPDGTIAYVKSEYLMRVDGLQPTATPEPTVEPTQEPTATPEPTAEPTEEPTATPEPTEEPTATPEPTAEPTEEPTAEPTEEPTATPEPTAEPTEEPTATPEPTAEPTEEPTPEPTEEPEETEQGAEFEYERNEDGSLVLDEEGNPIPVLVDGAAAKPMAYLRDADGNLMLDENGNPIPTDVEVEEDAQQPEEAPAEGELNPNRMVIVTPDLGGQEPHLGMEVKLVATVVGYEGVDYTLQWQKSTDNVNWTDVPGETGETCNVVVDEESCMEIWRAVAIVTDASEA